MMAGFINLVVRDATKSNDAYSPTMATLLVVLLVLITVALLSTALLYFLRYRKRKLREQGLLPLHAGKGTSMRSKHRRITVRPSESIYVYQEKQRLIASSSTPPPTSVPEIRITFPEEADEVGKRQSGRVVVVHVGDTGGANAVEPCSEKLPSYQQSESDRFQSLDLDRIGGLKEKDLEGRWQ